MENSYPTLGEEIARIERDLGIPEGFYDALMNEDDWSFVIKLHAFLDGSLTKLLTSHLARPELDAVFSRMELANQRTGKLAFARQLDLLSKTSIDYLLLLTELRNRYVHNIAQTGTKLSDNINTLAPSKLAMLAKVANWPEYASIPELLISKEHQQQFLAVFFKRVLWYGSFSVLQEIVVSRVFTERKNNAMSLAYGFFAKVAESITLKPTVETTPES